MYLNLSFVNDSYLNFTLIREHVVKGVVAQFFSNRFLVCEFLFGVCMSESGTFHLQHEISKRGLTRGGRKARIISSSLN